MHRSRRCRRCRKPTPCRATSSCSSPLFEAIELRPKRPDDRILVEGEDGLDVGDLLKSGLEPRAGFFGIAELCRHGPIRAIDPISIRSPGAPRKPEHDERDTRSRRTLPWGSPSPGDSGHVPIRADRRQVRVAALGSSRGSRKGEMTMEDRRTRTTTGSAARDVRLGPDQDARRGADQLGHTEDRLLLANLRGFVAAWKERLRRD